MYGRRRSAGGRKGTVVTESLGTLGACPFGPGFDFTDPNVLERGMPVAELARLRATAPVWWNEQAPGASIFDDGGYWVISKHRDIKAISRDSEVWSTNLKGAVMRMPDG
ncbi:MAG TPA: steroid C27-monooxygenase, partial [Mycobacterium sp.]|nr:steroid C27-monooxygenase [Mycobacterium sp.]